MACTETTTDFAGLLAGPSDKTSISFLEDKRAREAGWQDELPSAQAQGAPTLTVMPVGNSI